MQTIKLLAITLGVFSLGYLGAAEKGGLTPADNHNSKIYSEMADSDVKDSPHNKAMERDMGGVQSDHKNAYNSLSPKNKHAFKGLSDKDQQKVVDTHKKGGDHQKALSDILKSDQNQHNKSTGSKDGFFWDDKKKENSPASEAMKRGNKKKDDNIFD